MLYVGASLMIGASIYGFVDYKQNREKKAFSEMYTEVTQPTGVTEQPVVEEKKETVPLPAVKTDVEKTGTKKVVSSKKQEPVTAAVTEDKTISVDPVSPADPKPETEARPKAEVKKKKKLRLKTFSRAPLRDEMEPEENQELPAEEVKKERS